MGKKEVKKQTNKLKDKSFNSMIEYLRSKATIGEFELALPDKANDYAQELKDRYSYQCMLNTELKKEIEKLSKK
jgi:hypothetical protein